MVHSLLKPKPFLIKKSTPVVLRGYKEDFEYLSTSFNGIYAALLGIVGTTMEDHLRKWSSLSRTRFLPILFERFTSFRDDLRDSIIIPSVSDYTGKLAFLDEPAGKVRVIAMVDPLTQWAMKPLHDALFGLLEKIPQDGTFHQEKPLEYLLKLDGESGFFSYDLSSATDRLPVSFQVEVLSELIGSEAAQLWSLILTQRFFRIDDNRIRNTETTYSAGQPMGVYSSWAMLAISHHVIVQWAAMKAGVVGEDRWFTKYAILGDDIVIVCSKTADQYTKIMRELDVGINPSKSLVSKNKSVLEFAKRFYVNGENCSPLSLKDLATMGNFTQCVAYAKKHSLTLPLYLTILGYGHRTNSRATAKLRSLPVRLRRYILGYFSPSGPGYNSIRRFVVLRRIYTEHLSRSVMHPVIAVRFIRSFYADERKRLLERSERLFNQLDDFLERLAMGGAGHYAPDMFHLNFRIQFRKLWVKGKLCDPATGVIAAQSLMIPVYEPICRAAIAVLDKFDRNIRMLTPEMVGSFHPMLSGSGYEPDPIAANLRETSSDALVQCLLDGTGTEGVIEGLSKLSSELDHIPDLKKIETRELDRITPVYRLESIEMWRRYGESLRKTQFPSDWDLLKHEPRVIRQEYFLNKMYNLWYGIKPTPTYRLKVGNRNIIEMLK
jgi:hypothetical protein